MLLRDPQRCDEPIGTNAIFHLFNGEYQAESKMGPGFFFIAILGCADGSAACTPVATMPTRYESRAACAAATGATLAANTEFDFPTLLAECRSGKAPAASRSERTNRVPATARQG